MQGSRSVHQHPPARATQAWEARQKNNKQVVKKQKRYTSELSDSQVRTSRERAAQKQRNEGLWATTGKFYMNQQAMQMKKKLFN